MARQRIAVTGIGGICALGNTAPEIWSTMRAGRSAIGTITTTPLHDLKNTIGAEIKQLPEHGLDRKRLITMDRFSLLAIIAAGEALRDAGVAVDASNATRVGAVVGVGVFGVECIEDNYRGILVEGRPRANVFTVPRSMPSACNRSVARAEVATVSSGASTLDSTHSAITATARSAR